MQDLLIYLESIPKDQLSLSDSGSDRALVGKLKNDYSLWPGTTKELSGNVAGVYDWDPPTFSLGLDGRFRALQLPAAAYMLAVHSRLWLRSEHTGSAVYSQLTRTTLLNCLSSVWDLIWTQDSRKSECTRKLVGSPLISRPCCSAWVLAAGKLREYFWYIYDTRVLSPSPRQGLLLMSSLVTTTGQ